MIGKYMENAIHFKENSFLPKFRRVYGDGEGNGNPLQYPCLENTMDGGAWCATVHRISKSWTQLK